MRRQFAHLFRGVLLTASTLALGGAGCEIISQVDRGALDSNERPECAHASDCPDPGNECLERACSFATCTTVPVASGTAVSEQAAGDCKLVVCDGNGGISTQADDTDLPEDNNECTDNVCTSGTPSNPALAQDAACGMGGMLYCDGNGQCVGCTAPEQCGNSTDCSAPTCVAGTCGVSFVAAGTAIPAQKSGDCKVVVCDGNGATMSANDDADLPDDSNDCTDNVCTAGAPSNPNLVINTPCSAGGALYCDGAGKCVGCNDASQCGSPTDCSAPTCVNGACGVSYTMVGTPIPNQTQGDCQEVQCDGIGGTKSVAKNTDLPDDNKQCTENLCNAGIPAFPNSSSGKACNEGMGLMCNGAGACVGCLNDTDCASHVCTAQMCAAPTCMDLVQNGNETDVDCGGGTCTACANGKMCLVGSDCTSTKCTANVCVP